MAAVCHSRRALVEIPAPQPKIAGKCERLVFVTVNSSDVLHQYHGTQSTNYYSIALLWTPAFEIVFVGNIAQTCNIFPFTARMRRSYLEILSTRFSPSLLPRGRNATTTRSKPRK